MTAQDVAAAIAVLGAPYKVHQHSFVDNGVDCKMVGLLLASPEEESLSFLASLGIALPLHCKRLLMEFRSWSSP
jgi:hypothetical protein